MTPQKRLSLIYQAASSMESDLIIKPVDLQKLLNFAECVKLMAVQSDSFIAANAEGLAEGLGLPLELFSDKESEATNEH